jgi:hypothetical protein
VERLVLKLEHPNDVCKGLDDGGAEDINMGDESRHQTRHNKYDYLIAGLCMTSVGVKPGDSRDSQGRNRFFPFDVPTHINPNQEPKDWWYWDYIWWPMEGVKLSIQFNAKHLKFYIYLFFRDFHVVQTSQLLSTT